MKRSTMFLIAGLLLVLAAAIFFAVKPTEPTIAEQMRSNWSVIVVTNPDNVAYFESEGWETVILVSSYTEAMENLPDEAVEISVSCANEGELFTDFSAPDAEWIRIADGYCENRTDLLLFYIYPPAYEVPPETVET